MTENTDSRGNFFAIDKRVWAHVCGIGINAAVSYLVLGCFSQKNNRTTSASVNAIENYTTISRGRSQKALQQLIDRGVVTQKKGGTKPQYFLVPAHEVPDLRMEKPFSLSDLEQVVFKETANSDWRPRSKSERDALKRIKSKGWVRLDADGSIERVEWEAPEWIWLPNTLVMGAGSEVPPVEKLRQRRDVMVLRLFIDLYDVQNLGEEGGVPRRLLRQEYKRVKMLELREFTVWGFTPEPQGVTWGNRDIDLHRRDPDSFTTEEKAKGANGAVGFFERLDDLERMGLVEWVPHFFEGDDEDAEVLFICGDELGAPRDGDENATVQNGETELGAAAAAASEHLLYIHEDKLECGVWESPPLQAPVPRQYRDVQVVGIARLRYRPKTSLTASWWAKACRGRERFMPIFDLLSGSTPPSSD